MGLIAFISSLFGCTGTGPEAPAVPSAVQSGDNTGKPANENSIVYFCFDYNASMGGQFTYTVTQEEDGRIVFSYEDLEHRSSGVMSTEVTRDVTDALEELYRSCKLADWDGFNGSDPDMLDGDGFTLTIKFADGTRLRADGSNAYPTGYRDFTGKLYELLNPFRDKVLNEKRLEKISEGIHGTLSCIMVSLIQRGSSGRDEYFMLISSEGVRDPNFEVRIKSRSGEFLPEGEYKYYKSVPDDILNIAKVQELVEKYNLIEWYDLHGTASDPNNEEWYQIDLSFGDEMKISSYGTEHPTNYKKFRKALLTWLKDTIDAVDALPSD